MGNKPSVRDANVIVTPPEPPKRVANTTDQAPRPGFRAPANTRSKAQKAKKKR